MANVVQLLFKGDASALNRTMASVGDGAKKMSADVDNSVRSIHDGMSKFQSAMTANQATMGRTGAAAAAMGTTLRSIPFPLVATGAVAAAGAVVFAGVKMATAYRDATLRAADFAAQIGVSIESGSRFLAVTDRIGVNAEAMVNALDRFNSIIVETPEVFTKAGVSIARFGDGTVDMVGTLANVADAMLELGQSSEAATLANNLLGARWQMIAPVLFRGGDAIRNAAAAIGEHETKTRADEDAARSALEAQVEFKKGLEGLGNQFGQVILPALTDATILVTNFIEALGNLPAALDEVTKDRDWGFLEPLDTALDFVIGKAKDFADELGENSGIGRMTAGTEEATDAVTGLAEAWAGTYVRAAEQASGISDMTSASVDHMAYALMNAADEVQTLDEQLGELENQFRDIIGVQLSASDAQLSFQMGLQDLADSLVDVKTTLHGADRASLDYRQSINTLVADAQASATALREQGASADEAAEHFRGLIAAIVETATQAGVSRHDIEAYLATLGLTPESIYTIFGTNAPEAAAVVASYHGTITSLPTGWLTALDVDPDYAGIRGFANALNALPTSVITRLGVSGIMPGALDPKTGMPRLVNVNSGGGGGGAFGSPGIRIPTGGGGGGGGGRGGGGGGGGGGAGGEADALGDALEQLAREYEYGVKTRDEYLAHLRAHQAGYQFLSDDWVRITQEITAAEEDALQAQEDADAAKDRQFQAALGRLDTQYELGLRSRASYLANLKHALKAHKVMSEEWIDIQRRILRIEGELANEEAERQRKREQALEDARQLREREAQERRQYYQDTRQALGQASDLVSEFAQEDATSTGLVSWIKGEVAQLAQFRQTIGALRRAGWVPANIIDALVAAGPSAFDEAQALLNMDAGQRAEFVAGARQLEGLGHALATEQTNAHFASGAGKATTLTVNVAGSVLSEKALLDLVRQELNRIATRNGGVALVF